MTPPDPSLDHDLVFVSISTHKNNCRACYKRHVWKYDEADFEGLNAVYDQIPWHLCFEELDNINDIVDNITEIRINTAKSYIPNKLILIRPQDKPGMTKAVRKLIIKCRRLNKIRKMTKNQVDIENHRNVRREVKLAWKEAKTEFNENMAEKLQNDKTSDKAYWKLLKTNYANERDQNIPTLVDDDEIFCDAQEKANLLNIFFCEKSMLPPPDQNQTVSVLPPLTRNKVSDIVCSPQKVMNILKSLDVTKATGPDKISNSILKHCASTLCHPLSEIFNLGFSSGTFPIKWKEAHVQPIPKIGKSTNKNDYRPISLLSNISKVMEKIITKRLQEFFNNNKILNTRNSGFKKGDSAVYRLLELTHDIYQGMEDCKHTCTVFLDISKAFDRVWHAGLF